MDYVSNDKILEGQRTVMAKKSIFEDIDLLGSTFADLRGRQSVRATFKLTSDCIDAIGIVAAQLGIKQKSLFDHLFQDADTLSSIARKVKNAQLRATDRVQKTYVMSRSALLQLEEIARHFNASRDVLIEVSVQRLLPIIANERKRYRKRKEIFNQIQQHLEQGRRLLKTAYAELGEDDPLTDRLTAAIGVYESANKQIAAVLEKGKDIETFEPESFKRVEIRFEKD
jgi:hypothetical protein